jgi:hypothetical protein
MTLADLSVELEPHPGAAAILSIEISQNNIQRLFTEGGFTATYKYALLMALGRSPYPARRFAVGHVAG